MPDKISKPHILIADDDDSSRKLLQTILSDKYDYAEAASAEEVLAMPQLDKFNLIISDIKMTGISGLEMIPQALKLAPDALVVISSGFHNIEAAIEAMRAGAFDYITKPFDFEQVEAIVHHALEYQALRLANRNAENEKLRLASIIEFSDDSIISQTFDGEILSWNKGAESIFAYAAEEAIGQNIKIIFPEETFHEEQEIIAKIKNGAHITNFETILKDKYDRFVPISLTVSPIKNEKGEITGVSKIARNITKRKVAEQALKQSEERYRAFIKQSSEGIWRFEISTPISTELSAENQISLVYQHAYLAECNDAMASQYGYTQAAELIGKRINEFLVPDDKANVEQLHSFIKSNYQVMDAETLETDRHGRNKYFLNNFIGIIENGKLVRIWGTRRDITLVKQTEQAFLEAENQRRQSQKIEAVGRLAGGVAHDFNNFLAVITLHVDMLNLQLPADSPLRYRLDEIKSVTNNAAAMVRQLLAFSRKQPMQPHPVVLNKIIREFVKILRPLVGADIDVQLNLDEDLGVCFVDHNQITQILMNLIVNAKDAMAGGGTIKIETGNISLNKKTVYHKAQPPGLYTQMTISDNGIGMDSTTQERIFEPFFTTKEIGKGTGLGLATVYGIVKQSNGFIWVQSAPQQGTTFIIQFPRIDEPAEIVLNEVVVPSIPHGSETILIVEDEEQVRRAAVEVLQTLGYQVFEASNGMQAIQLAELFTRPIHLLLTDVIMPRMNGKELAEKITSLHSETAVLFMSGYTDDIIAQRGTLEENINFLGKPFSHQTLAIKVRDVLDAQKNSTE